MVKNEGAREELRNWLVKHTGCSVQSGVKGKKRWLVKYPCGTCFMALLNDIGLDKNKPAYKEHNDDYERHNEIWRAILQIREAK